ncbi:unnamed protein product, partial [Dracunculus medinensis]|uniref:G_PROTEIN_RECEP_F1_2 domain-containing protein n=1 Tax=Dracunculus medinensis TaxID=318479 RepID=A0A0N4UJR6_DRAME
FLATIVIHLWTHFIGFYAYIIRDRISRAIFLRARNAFAAEEKAIQENAKLVIICPFINVFVLLLFFFSVSSHSNR